MRFNSEITLYEEVEIEDEYGGVDTSYENPIDYKATASVGNNELKPKPSGLGFHRILTVMLEKNILQEGDIVEHNGVRYRIGNRVLYEHSFLEAFMGYEV